MENRVINAAILGAGTVGGGVYKLAQAMEEDIFHKTGARLVIKKMLVRNVNKERKGIPSEILTDDWNSIINDPEIDIIVELMGGITPAKKYVIEALNAGKQVVTANKDLLAEYGEEVMSAAEKSGNDLQFEAAVAGAIPIIRPLKQSMAGNHITEVMGIVNGTTNYILTKMTEKGMDYADALAEATELGYAEADPTADVEGYDACRKIAILSSLMFGKNVDSEKVPTEGITKITAADFEYANAAKYTIKLLGRSRAIDDDTAEVMVAPFMLPKDHPLAMVYGVFNAVFVTGNMLGDSMYYGRGAGKLPTASAVVSDVIDCARHQGKVIMCFWDKEEVKLADIGEAERSFFIRAKAGAEDAVTAAFPGGRVVHLKDRKEDFGYFTQSMKEKDFQAKYEALGEQMLGRIRLV